MRDACKEILSDDQGLQTTDPASRLSLSHIPYHASLLTYES